MRIKDLYNLGEKTGWYCKGVGIETVEKFKKHGVVQAYCDLKEAFPDRVNTTFLWALEGALSNTHWQEIPPERKEQLKKLVEIRFIASQKIPLQNFPGIGKTIEKKLNAVNIFTKEDLEKIGAVESYKKITKNVPKNQRCVCLLYTLEGALLGVEWHKIPEKLKEKCKKEKQRLFSNF